MYTALYRTYRPEVFNEILGQEHIVKILKNQIDTDTTSHAYLFCGTRGTGKTTTARILAKGLNCTSETGDKPCGKCDACISIKEGTFIDVVEIDAASNNGVDNIRELRESVKYPPAAGKKKVYIIDEVHMLSPGAFNALLKTLEEPPDYVVFILATTEPQKLPATILSRCMRLDFRRIPEAVLIDGMSEICKKKDIKVSDDALRIIAANSDGSVRDGLSILDQCISGGDDHVEAEDVLEFLGASGEATFIELTDMVKRKKTGDALMLLEEILSDGKDVRQFMRDWIKHYRNLMMTRFIKDPQDIINMSAESVERIREQSESLDPEDINTGMLELSRTMNEDRWSTQPRILLELAIMKMSAAPPAEEKISPPKITDDNGHNDDERRKDGKEQKTGGKEEDKGQETKWDYDKLWKDVLDDGEATKGSIYMVCSKAHLTHMDDVEFTVALDSDNIEPIAKNNKQLLEDLMEKHTGSRRAMKIVTAGDAEEMRSEDTAEHKAEKAGEALGINVGIE